jgi:hypothetical protein
LGHDTPDPRQQCINDFKVAILQDKHIGSEIVLLEDINEVVGDAPELMASVCAKCHLYDLFSDLYPDQVDIPT